MSRKLGIRTIGASRTVRIAAALSLALAGFAAHATVIYSNLQDPLPGNLPSLGYQATSTTELGDHIQFAAGPRKLDSVTITMSNWALESTYGTGGAGYLHDLTFSIYNYVNDTAAGSLITSDTINALIPWRPEADPTCPNGGTAWRATNGACYNGLAFNVTFDFSDQNIVLPDDILFGLSFNTQSYGETPTGVSGAYNSLNYALVSASPSVGTDVNPDSLFWNTSYQPFLTTGVAGTFGADTAWTGYVPAVRFDASAVPEPATLALLSLGLIGLAGMRRKV